MTQVFFFFSFSFSFLKNVFFPRNYIGGHNFKVYSKEIFRRTFTFSIIRYYKKPRWDLLVIFQARETSYFGKRTQNATNAIYASKAMCLCGAKRPSSHWGLPRCLVSSVVSNIFRLSHRERRLRRCYKRCLVFFLRAILFFALLNFEIHRPMNERGTKKKFHFSIMK